MKLTESKLRNIIQEEIRLLTEQEVVIESGVIIDGVEFTSRRDFERHYVNDGKPDSTKYTESVQNLIELDNKLHQLSGKLMDHDRFDHELGDRVPKRKMLPSHKQVAQHIQNIEKSGVEGDPGESFLDLNKRILQMHAQVHSAMAQHIRHHTDMGGNDDVIDNT